MFGFFNSKKEKEVNWIQIENIEDLNLIHEKSFTKPQIIFKHSTRCSISNMALNRMEEGFDTICEKAEIYYLDLLGYRDISNEIAKKWDVVHESPQAIIILNGSATYVTTHNKITPTDLALHLD